ncbi:MAG: hypothetical protein ABL901_20375 [Hyphomicrobiaceae bacterium]
MTDINDNKEHTFNEHPLVASVRQYLQQIGLPSGDLNTLPDSSQRFEDGGSFRIEVPTINSVAACEAALRESDRRGIKINRITETLGLFRHTKQEITEWVQLCKDYGCELVMSPGPRAPYDTGASVQTQQGSRIGYRLRGQEQLVRALVDIRRAVDLGVESFLVYDEGMLSVLDQMRRDRVIPEHVHFKVSAHCGHGNPASVHMLWKLGANSVNPVRDLQLPMIAAIRASLSIPLDIHTDNPAASGGFMRIYEAPEIVRIASPVHLKTGNSVLKGHGEETSPGDAERMVRQAAIIVEVMGEFAPKLKQAASAGLGGGPV